MVLSTIFTGEKKSIFTKLYMRLCVIKYFIKLKFDIIYELRDVIIITSLDTVTSMLAGCTIFGILGNLAYELGIEDISKVVRGGTGLAFVSYPDAIAKFNVLPQVLLFILSHIEILLNTIIS